MSETQAGLVQRDLAFAADLVGDLFPGGGDVVGAVLGRELAGVDLGQFVLGDRVVLEDTGDAGLDCRVGVVVAVGLGGKVVLDERLVIAGLDPFRDVEVRVPAFQLREDPPKDLLSCKINYRFTLNFSAKK